LRASYFLFTPTSPVNFEPDVVVSSNPAALTRDFYADEGFAAICLKNERKILFNPVGVDPTRVPGFQQSL